MRLVDADSLMEKATSDGAYGYVDAKQISEAPTVDAVPVVRCRECKHHHDCDTHFCDALGMDCPDDSEFFCSYGKRKEGTKND